MKTGTKERKKFTCTLAVAVPKEKMVCELYFIRQKQFSCQLLKDYFHLDLGQGFECNEKNWKSLKLPFILIWIEHLPKLPEK